MGVRRRGVSDWTLPGGHHIGEVLEIAQLGARLTTVAALLYCILPGLPFQACVTCLHTSLDSSFLCCPRHSLAESKAVSLLGKALQKQQKGL